MVCRPRVLSTQVACLVLEVFFRTSYLYRDEATFRVKSCALTGIILGYWALRSQKPHEMIYYVRDSLKQMFGAVCCPVIGPFSFIEQAITGNVYLDMLQQYVFILTFG